MRLRQLITDLRNEGRHVATTAVRVERIEECGGSIELEVTYLNFGPAPVDRTETWFVKREKDGTATCALVFDPFPILLNIGGTVTYTPGNQNAPGPCGIGTFREEDAGLGPQDLAGLALSLIRPDDTLVVLHAGPVLAAAA